MARVYGGYFLFRPVTKGKRADGIIGPVRFVPYMPEKKNSQAFPDGKVVAPSSNY